MKTTGSGDKHSKSNRRKRHAAARGPARFVVCVKSKGYPASLEFGKIYRCLRDRGAEQHMMRRIIDDSAGDYLYPTDWFIELRLPPAARRALASI